MDTPKLPPLKLTNSQTVSRQIYVFLRHHITQMTLKPGTRLSENDLSCQLNVSRQPVREAFFSLKRQNLIEVYPQKGSFVTKISGKRIMETCFVRCSIETSSLRKALADGNGANGAIWEELERNLEAQDELIRTKDKVEDPDAVFLKLDNEFHRILCKFSGTRMAWDVIDDIKANLDRSRYLSTKGVSEIGAIVGEHHDVYNEMRHGDERRAVRCLTDHLYEIALTYKAIREKNASWFTEEE